MVLHFFECCEVVKDIYLHTRQPTGEEDNQFMVDKQEAHVGAVVKIGHSLHGQSVEPTKQHMEDDLLLQIAVVEEEWLTLTGSGTNIMAKGEKVISQSSQFFHTTTVALHESAMIETELYEGAKHHSAIVRKRNISNTMGAVSNFVHIDDRIDFCNMCKEWERCRNKRLQQMQTVLGRRSSMHCGPGSTSEYEEPEFISYVKDGSILLTCWKK